MVAETSRYGVGTTVALDFEPAIEATKQALAAEGFGILCEIDVAGTLQRKLNVDFRPYVILGACSPAFAHQALTADRDIGLLLPCNVIVYADDTPGHCVVAAIDPVVALGVTDNADLRPLADEVKLRLSRALSAVERNASIRQGGTAAALGAALQNRVTTTRTPSPHETRKMYSRHEEYVGLVNAPADRVFEYLDDQTRLSSHMKKRSWRMGWGKMNLTLDEMQGRVVGSHIVLEGRVVGIRLFLDEVVSERVQPTRKTWETVGQPRLLVIGPYRMGFELTSDGNATRLRVAISYELPQHGFSWLLGRLFGRSYAKWCTKRMVMDAQRI